MGMRKGAAMPQWHTPDAAKRHTTCATPPPAPARRTWRDVAGASPTTPITPPALEHRASRKFDSPDQLRTPTITRSSSRLDDFTPGQEPDSAKYLARLFRLARRQSALPPESPCARRGRAPPQHDMDFLSSFNVGGDSGPPIDSDKFGSVDELALHLRGLLEQKTTPTRAEHCAVTLELRPTIQFHLTLSESENEAFQGASSVDPSMGGIRSASMSVDPAGQTTRSVSGNDTLMNQSNNPVLQRTVAKHIIGILSTVDHSNWALRDLSRGQQGWTFTYICAASVQQWTRQLGKNGKNPSSFVVGEYSQKEPDETLMNRPAFDCRGSMTVAFNRSSRSISVKYDHTLLHKTVGQLNDEWQPPTKELGIGYQRQQELKKQQQNVQQKTKRAAKRERKRKEREENAAATEETGERPAKRKRATKKKTKKTQAATAADASDAQPVGTDQSVTAQTSSAATGGIAFSVTAEEATRRLQVARTLLSEHGVNPDSLSADQMNIFSNQSPELQKDSVTMLAKYGAERLQIIHPGNKDKSASSSSPVPTTQATPSGPITTKELAPETATSGRKKKPSAKAAAATAGTPTKPGKRMGKSRIACLACKGRKIKCPKERPACSECASHNQPCEYPPQAPRSDRKKTKKSEEVVIDDDNDEDDDEEEDEDTSEVQRPPQPDAPFYNGTQHAEMSHGDMSYSNNMPVSDMLTPSAQHLHQVGNDSSYFGSGSGLDLPQPPAAQQPAPHHSGLALPQPVQPPDITQEPPLVTSPRQQRAKAKSAAAAAARRSLPTGAAESATNDANMNASAPHPSSGSWAAVNTQQVNSNPAMTTGLAQQAARNQQRSRQSNNGRKPTDSPQLNDNIARPASNPQQPRQQVPKAQQSSSLLAAMQAQARTSPLQNGQRADSRQGQRNQSRTPNADQNTARGYQPPPQSSNDLAGSANHNNFGRYSGSNPPASDANSRAPYEPYDFSNAGSNSYPAYDYNRSTTSTSRPQDRSSGYSTASSYQQNPTSTASLQNFDMRGSSQKRVSTGSKQPYSQYGSQQSQDQQMGQPGWNNFNYSGSNQFGSTNSGWM